MMGMTADTLGNHNFDRGSDVPAHRADPAGRLPVPGGQRRCIPNNGKLPPEWKPSQVFNFDGFKLGVIGYTLPELPTLIFPGYLDPFMVTDPAAAINAEAAKLRSKGKVNASHRRRAHGRRWDGYHQSRPRPLIDLADSLTGVDAVLGGHTHTQYITYPPNGMLVTENPNAGHRFTRIRLTVDTNTKKVIYKTADYHKPWNIGVTPDPAIQAMIDDLNAAAGADLQHGDRQLDGYSPARRFLRPRGWPAVRIADRRCDDRCAAHDLHHRLRHHQLGRPARRPDLPDHGRRRRLLPGLTPRRRTRSRAARCWRCCRSATWSSR